MIQLRVHNILESFQSFFTIRVESFVAFAIIAYFSGWQYVNAYFSYFNVNRSSFSFDDYTIFLYFFYVLVKLPQILLAGTSDSIAGITFLIVMVLVSSIGFSKPIHIAINLVQRIVIVGLGIGCLFSFSLEAGRIEADRVAIQGQARPISIVLSKEFIADMVEYRGQAYTDEWITMMKNWDDRGALGLIWRNSNETMLQIYETQGPGLGRPAETYRIPNRFIVSIKSKSVQLNLLATGQPDTRKLEKPEGSSPEGPTNE